MQRPRNHQNRGPHGRGHDQSRGGFQSDVHGRAQDYGKHLQIPSINQVIPGAMVSIVLKEDQSTGRQTQGQIADVLTKGNHPRGIKVRLVGGRVGRVQRMINEQETVLGQDGSRGVGKSDNNDSTTAPSQSHHLRYRDVRLEDTATSPPSTYDLEAWLPANHPLRHKDSERPGKIRNAQASEPQVCPVCRDFQGDETAVAHHVGSHFD